VDELRTLQTYLADVIEEDRNSIRLFEAGRHATKPAIGGCVIAPWEVCYPYTPLLCVHPLQATSGKASGQPYYAFYYVIFSFPIPRWVIMIPQPAVSSLSPSSTPNDLSLRGGLSYVHTCDAGEASLARIRFAIRTSLCSPLLRFSWLWGGHLTPRNAQARQAFLPLHSTCSHCLLPATKN